LGTSTTPLRVMLIAKPCFICLLTELVCARKISFTSRKHAALQRSKSTRHDLNFSKILQSRGELSFKRSLSETLALTGKSSSVPAESDVLQPIRKHLGILHIGQSCNYTGADRIGCHIGCECSWGERCYRKDIVNAEDMTKTNVGVCQASIAWLTTTSLLLFLGSLALMIALRMLLTHLQDDRNDIPEVRIWADDEPRFKK